MNNNQKVQNLLKEEKVFQNLSQQEKKELEKKDHITLNHIATQMELHNMPLKEAIEMAERGWI